MIRSESLDNEVPHSVFETGRKRPRKRLGLLFTLVEDAQPGRNGPLDLATKGQIDEAPVHDEGRAATAVQVHGAVALEEGHLLERLYRDVRAPRIYEGASEVQRSIIARRLYD